MKEIKWIINLLRGLERLFLPLMGNTDRHPLEAQLEGKYSTGGRM